VAMLKNLVAQILFVDFAGFGVEMDMVKILVAQILFVDFAGIDVFGWQC